MSFKEQLFRIRDELSNYHRNKADLLEYYISSRLNQSLSVYYQELAATMRFLEKKDSLRVMRKLNKGCSKDE